jgi:hypothetical protein
MSAAQRLWAKEAEADMKSFVWHQRSSDLKLFIRLMNIEPAPEDDRIDTKDFAVRAVFAYLAALEEGEEEGEEEDEDASASGSASGSGGAAGGETQALPAASQVPMAPVVHARPANILFFVLFFWGLTFMIPDLNLYNTELDSRPIS